MDLLYKVELEKVKNDHDRLRTDKIEGVTRELPVVGKSFILLGEGLEFGTRCVNTSPVKEVSKDGHKYTIKTESGSIYSVSFLGTYL